MDQHQTGRIGTRGTIFVASRNSSFSAAVGALVEECGFTPAFLLASESMVTGVGRTQPDIVIADCDAPLEAVRGLIGDASARRLPLVLAQPREAPLNYTRGINLVSPLRWLSLPVSSDDFCTMIDGLVPAAANVTRSVSLDAGIARIDAAVRVRTLGTP